MTEKLALASRIRTLREQVQLTQADFGAEIGASRAHVAKIETGGDLPGRDLMKAIAVRFGVSLDWLSHGHGDMRPARPLSEREALLLFAFRQMPEDEAEAHLNLMLRRVKPTAT